MADVRLVPKKWKIYSCDLHHHTVNLATILIVDELRNTIHVQLIKSVQCRSRTYTLTSYNHLLPEQIMRPTSSLLGASRLPLTTKRANKDFYKGTPLSRGERP